MADLPDSAELKLIQQYLPDFSTPGFSISYEKEQEVIQAIFADVKSGKLTAEDKADLNLSYLKFALESVTTVFPNTKIEDVLQLDSLAMHDYNTAHTGTSISGMHGHTPSGSLSGSLTPKAEAELSDRMLGMSWYLEVIEHEDYVDLYAKYDNIIGSRKLLRVDTEGFKPFAEQLVEVAQLRQQSLDDRAQNKVKAKGTTIPAPGNTMPAELIGLETFIIEGNKAHLPKDHLANYATIKAALTKAGGKYSAKGYFEFQAGLNPIEIMTDLIGGKKINHQQSTQFFATPEQVGLDLIATLGDLSDKDILEPSAGDGALADLARDAGANVTVVENWTPNVIKLQDKGYDVIDRSFLELTPDDLDEFDIIIANPPFSKNQDIDHVNHMLTFLKPGGTLAAIVSTGALEGSQAKQRAFQGFLEENNASVSKVEANAFKTSGTSVETMQIIFKKPELVLERTAVASTRPSSF